MPGAEREHGQAVDEARELRVRWPRIVAGGASGADAVEQEQQADGGGEQATVAGGGKMHGRFAQGGVEESNDRTGGNFDC